MKKRVLLTILFVMLLSLLVAFTASAQEYELVDDLGDPSWYTGNYEYMTDKTSQVVLVDSEGNYTAYPAYYILKYSITVSNGAVTAASISSIDYSHVSKNGKSYEAGAIYKIEFPEGLTTISSGIFGLNIKEPNVTEVVIPETMTTIGTHAFRATTNLKKVVFPKNLAKIDEYAFYEAKGLEEFVLPGGSEEYLDISGSNIFYGCSALKEADLSTRKIRKIGNACFSKCTALGKVTLPDTVEEIGTYFLFECYNAYLASDFLPTSLKKINFQFMAGCKAVDNRVIYFPEGFTGGEGAFDATYILATERYKTTNTTLVFLGKMTGTIALEQFHVSGSARLTLVFTQNDYNDLTGNIVQASTDGTKNYVGTDYTVKEGTLTLKLGNAAESHSKNGTDASGNTLYKISDGSYQLLFCAGDDVEVCYGVRENSGSMAWNKAITSPFVFDRQGHMDAGVHYDLTEVVSIANCGIEGIVENTCVICDRVAQTKTPATGNHTLSQISPCADKCSVCELYIQRAEQSHILNEIITYLNGYDAQGEYKATCSNEGCTHVVTENTNAIFTYLGYSAPMSGNGGIAVGFSIDNVALNTYEEITGKTLSFGVFAAAQQKLGESTIFDEDGNAMTGVINADLTSYSVDAFEIKIVGFNDTQKDLKLVMGAYATEDGVKYSYLQSTNVGSKMGAHYAVSYNEVVASLVANEAA